MPRKIRDRLTYANVMSTLAVFVALGGSSYAAVKIHSRDIADNTVRSRDLRNNDVRGRDVRNGTLTGKDVKRDGIGGLSIKESRLGKVPRAGDADTVSGRNLAQLRVRCPLGTIFHAGVCIEVRASAPLNFGSAGDICEIRNRRLPTWAELKELFDDGTSSVAAGGEFTSNVYGETGILRVVVITSNGGSTVFQQAFTPSARAFRCVAPPLN
jgi:hypothetical protein